MDKENEKIEPFEDIDLRRSCEPLPDIPRSVPDYSIDDIPKIEFNEAEESSSWVEFRPVVPSLDSIDKDLDSIRTAILSRHAIATSASSEVKVETLGKYSSDDIEEMYTKGLNDGMKRAVDSDSPLVEIIIKKAADKLSKLKSGEWIILSMSMPVSYGPDKIKYVCSNCETEYTRTIFSRELPNYCENCGSKNSVRYETGIKRPW